MGEDVGEGVGVIYSIINTTIAAIFSREPTMRLDIIPSRGETGVKLIPGGESGGLKINTGRG